MTFQKALLAIIWRRGRGREIGSESSRTVLYITLEIQDLCNEASYLWRLTFSRNDLLVFWLRLLTRFLSDGSTTVKSCQKCVCWGSTVGWGGAGLGSVITDSWSRNLPHFVTQIDTVLRYHPGPAIWNRVWGTELQEWGSEEDILWCIQYYWLVSVIIWHELIWSSSNQKKLLLLSIYSWGLNPDCVQDDRSPPHHLSSRLSSTLIAAWCRFQISALLHACVRACVRAGPRVGTPQ